MEANTRDERGATYVTEEEVPPTENLTRIVVSEPSFVDCFFDRDRIFLPEGMEERESSDVVQVLNQPSNHVYYRGLRVMDLEKPSLFTYNIVAPTELTEDRTIKYEFMANAQIVRHVMKSEDKDLIRSILEADENETYEGRLDFDNSAETASQTFLNLVRTAIDEDLPLLPRARTYYSRYYPAAPSGDMEITVEFKLSHIRTAYAVLNQIDLYDMAEKMGWEEEDPRFDGFVALRDKFFEITEEHSDA